jgi:hypothetical protein
MSIKTLHFFPSHPDLPYTLNFIPQLEETNFRLENIIMDMLIQSGRGEDAEPRDKLYRPHRFVKNLLARS